MQQQALESVWTQLSPLGQQIVNICFQRLLECINDVEERRRVLALIEFTVAIENRTLENSERLQEFMREILQAAINQQVGPVEEAKGIEEDATEQNALQINAPVGSFSTTSSSDEDSKTGSEHSNE
jgi:precorrin-3B methylase